MNRVGLKEMIREVLKKKGTRAGEMGLRRCAASGENAEAEAGTADGGYILRFESLLDEIEAEMHRPMLSYVSALHDDTHMAAIDLKSISNQSQDVYSVVSCLRLCMTLCQGIT